MAGKFLITLANTGDLSGLIKNERIMGISAPRVAFVGRSNVGKSSLINALLESPLARISKKPGKTRTINFYTWSEKNSVIKIIADLPGYGFAHASHEEKDQWAMFVNNYLKFDPALERAVVLLDSRHGPTKLDLQAIEFLSFEGIPVTFVFTKVDTIRKKSELATRRKEVAGFLKSIGSERSFWVSVKSKDGIRDLKKELLGI